MTRHSQWFVPKQAQGNHITGIVNCPKGGSITCEANSSVADGQMVVWLWASNGQLICCYYCDSLTGSLCEWEVS